MEDLRSGLRNPVGIRVSTVINTIVQVNGPETQKLVDCIVGAWRTQALLAAIDLGVIELLHESPQSVAEIASSLGLNCDGLIRLLRALCTLGVCCEHPSKQFSITRTGRLLSLEGVDGVSLRSLTLWWGGPMWHLWPGLDYSVRTGMSYREKLTGERQYGHLDHSMDQAQVFHEAMRSLTGLVAPNVTKLSLWKAAAHFVDVGGGIGQLALSVLKAHAHLTATVVDLAHAEQRACKQIASAGLASRCRFAIGSFFEVIPDGADVYLLKSILHNWDDEHAGRILATCRKAAQRGARLVLVERIRSELMMQCAIDESVARADLNMLVGLGGRERTSREYELLLGANGFEIEATHETEFEFSVLVAVAA
jgi:orsellinic acid C2-O-methyltransferase